MATGLGDKEAEREEWGGKRAKHYQSSSFYLWVLKIRLHNSNSNLSTEPWTSKDVKKDLNSVNHINPATGGGDMSSYFLTHCLLHMFMNN